jgi:hypothetical protein
MAYNPADFELVEAPASSAPPYNPADFELVAEPESSGILRQAADIPVSAAGGVIGGLKGVSDIFGAGNPVSLTLADYRKFYQDSMSPEGKADAQRAAAIMQEAQDKGVLAQAGAAARAFAVNPLDTIAGAAGSLAPTIATGVVGKAVGLGAKGIQAAQIAMGAGQGAGFIKGSIYDATKQYLLEQGIPEDKAEAAAVEAQKYNGENWDQIALGLGLGAAATGIGLERIIGKAIGGGVKDASRNIVTAGIKAAVQEGVPEAAQGGQEQLAQNLALIRQGANIPAMRGVVSQATLEGMAGMVAGGPVGMADFAQTPDMVQRARQAAAAPASFVPTPEVDPALVAAEFGDATDQQQAVIVDVQQQAATTNPPEISSSPEVLTVDEQAAAPIEQPQGSAIDIPASGEPIAVDNRTQADTSALRGPESDGATSPNQPDAQRPAARGDSKTGGGNAKDVGRGAVIADNPATPRSPATGGEGPGQPAADDNQSVKDAIDAMVSRYVQRHVDEQRGQVVLDSMEDAGESPRQIVKDFYDNVYDNLPPDVRARFDRYVKRLGWPLPKSLDPSPKAIGRHGAEGFSDSVLELEGIERGFVALARTAMDIYGKAAQELPSSPPLAIAQPPQPVAGEAVAAPVRLFRGIAKTVDYTTGDEFYSASQDVAGEYAAQDGKQGEVVETTLADVAKNPYRVFDKAEAAAALGIDMPVTDVGFDAAIKAKLQPMGHDAVIYEAGTDFEGGGEMEVHKFAPAVQPNPQPSPASESAGSSKNVAATAQPAAAKGDGGKAKARIRKNLNPNSGAADATILLDLVDYGKQFYRAGMTFGKWSAQMVAEFGQAVARYLRMAYDRIVKAYKDSPYSSEAGSVGDVRPKQEQESLNRRAKADTGLSDEAKAAMGDGIYDVMPLYGEGNIMDQAIAEIERLGGTDAAAAKVVELEGRPGGLEPIEMAMAIHLARQLDATNPTMAGNMVRIASTKGRSMGQANAAIKLFAEIDTATINHYAQTLVEQEASSVSEDYARLIADAGKDLREAKAEFYKEKLRIIHASILELQAKGEKIITKIREAIPDNARRTKMLDDIRTILKGDIGRQEAIREVAKLMKDNGIPPTSAQAWSNSIVSNVFKLTGKAKAALARDMAKKHSWRVRSWKKLLGEVENGEISDTDFLANLTALSGFPHISRATGAKLKKWAAEYKTAKDQRLKEIIAFQIWEEIHSQVPPEIAMQLRAFAYLSMLSYPLTWVKNIGGNAILFGANTAKDALIGTVIDPAVAALRTGKRASVGYGNLGVRIKGLAEPVRVIRRGMKYEQEVNPNATTWERFRVGLRHLRLLSKMTSQNKWDISDAKEAGRRMFGDKFMFGVFGDKVQAPGLMRLWESGLSVALGGPDRAFWEAEFRASLAQREAAAKTNGEWTGMHTHADMEAAFEDAARAIFQNANPISQGLGKIRGGLNWLSTLGLTEQFGLGTVLIAFTQVPGSILVRGAFDWSPLGFTNAAYQWLRPSIFRATAGRFGGQFDQRKFNNAMAEALLGTSGLVGAGFWLASMGILTASEDDDRDVADANKAQRIMPFSVNLSALGRVLAGDLNKQQPQTGDFTVRYDWAQPLAIAVASGAEMAVQLERARIKGLTGIEAANSVKTVLTAGLKSLEEQPLVSGMASFARTWGFSGLYDAIAMTALKAPSMFIPQIARRSAQYMDNTVRETRGGDFVTRPFQQIAASLPYLSSQYPARIDVTGKPMERFPDAGNTWYNLTINPIVTSRVRLDPVLQEATRLMNMTGERSQFPRQVGRTTEINGKKVELTNDQITRYNYYVGNMTMAMLQYRMGRAKYQRSSDDEKARLFAKDLSDVAAVARVGVFGADRRKLSPDQRQILREFLKSPIAQSNPPTEASPPPQ